MKKFAKMSLVAAVAVAGLSSTVSAKDLAESIKGVDFSGSVTYRYDDRKYDNNATPGATTKAYNSFSIVTHTKAKINDDASLNVEVDVFESSDTGASSAAGTVSVREIYFDYTAIKNTTIKFGKQAVDTPWTDAYDYMASPTAGTGQQAGNGIVAAVKAGPATLAAAYFTDTDFEGASDIGAIAAIVPVGPVNLQAWYIDVSEESAGSKDGRDSYYFEAATKLEGWSLMASYTSMKTDADLKDNLLKLTAAGKIGPVGVKAGYAQNSKKDGSGTTAYDVDAKTNFLVWSTSSNGKSDFSGFYVGADMNVIPSTNIALVYADSESDGGQEFSELIGQVSYKMSKNFSTYLRYALQESKADTATSAVDLNRGRIQIKYDF